MSEILKELIKEKNKLTEKIKEINIQCEGEENEENAKELEKLNEQKNTLLNQKNDMDNKVNLINIKLNEINKEIMRFSENSVDKILEAIKKQRWYFFKNKTKILLDKNTGKIYNNLNYPVKPLDEENIVDGIKGWRYLTVNEARYILDENEFYFSNRGTYHYIQEMDKLKIDDNRWMQLGYYYPTTNCGESGGLLYISSAIVPDEDYEMNLKEKNEIFSEKEKLIMTLNIFIDNQLEPIFEEKEITELYRKVYIERPQMSEKLKELEMKINELQEEILLSSEFDYTSILGQYKNKEIDKSIIKYYEAIQKWINSLMEKLNYFESEKNDIIRDFNIISLKLSKKYEENLNLTKEENKILKDRQAFFKKKFELGMNNVKTQLLSIKEQANDIQDRIDEINCGDNAIKELALLEKEDRASFSFITENTANIIKNALLKIEYFEKNRDFTNAIVKLEGNWTEGYKVFKTTVKDEFKTNCEEDNIEEELWLSWYEDWRSKRQTIETCFLPLVKKGLKGEFVTNKLTNENDKSVEPSIVEKIIGILDKYKKNIDKFYTEERKNIYQKFAFQTGGDLQEKFETESEIYKITSKFQKDMQDVIFSLDKAEERIFLLKWANDLFDIQIDEILDFIKDKELDKISQEVLIEFADLKKKNYEAFLNDAKAYSEESSNREKQYNSLIFKMRKELMK